ncbi:MAG: DNA primase [Anaerolineae bacterium]|nr:DNA primase [Anaerolineae bacterium]
MSVTEEIKARLDIVNFIGQYVQLRKAGRNHVARCPFHNERTPSFVVSEESQTWRCFGACAEGGDIFNFVMKREGMDFPTALRYLAEKAGVELEARTPEQVSAEQKLDKLRGLLEESARFYYDKLLNFGPAAAARGYVRKRGLNRETVDKFQIGYAPKPDNWSVLLDHLLRLGYSEEDAINAGVAIRNDNGRVYDRFRHRLMIPICDIQGRVVGFGARALDPDDQPKYLNSPQSAIFDKSAILFGLHHARRTIREQETVVIVEGYMDAIQAHQGGFNNVVAQMGTALTEPQLRQLSKFAKRLILALDPDAAGAKATMRGLEVIRQASDGGEVFFDPGAMMRQASRLDVEIRILMLPDERDPDEVIRDDPKVWEQAVADATPVADYVIAISTAGINAHSSTAEREDVARQLLPMLVATENDLHKHVNIQKLALKLRLNERTLLEWAMEQRAKLMPRQKFANKSAPAANQSSDPAAPSAAPAATQNTGTDAQSPSTPTEAAKVNGQNQRQRTHGVAAERHCLAVLLRAPGWLSQINRKLKELSSQTRIDGEGLSPFSEQDFTVSDFRAIMSTLLNALAQYDLEVEEYLDQHLPYELRHLAGELRGDLLVAFEQRADPLIGMELQRIREEQARLALKADVGQELRVFVRRALELRKVRLSRENTELQFLQREETDTDDWVYRSRVAHNHKAILLLDKAIREIDQNLRL